MHDLLAERMMQEPLVKGVSMAMQRGSEHEAEAVAYYELERSIDSVTVGFITNDEGTIGASPDRLIGDDGLLEIKVPSPGTHVGYLLNEAGAGDHYKAQTQGQLWVTGRKFVDVMSYCPGLPEALVRFERDEGFIARLAAAVSEFSSRLESFTAMFRERGWITARKEESAERPDEPRLWLDDGDLEWALTRSIEIHQKQATGGESGGMA
jgi:hypothetical protein